MFAHANIYRIDVAYLFWTINARGQTNNKILLLVKFDKFIYVYSLFIKIFNVENKLPEKVDLQFC